jgi:hypothetical protein
MQKEVVAMTLRENSRLAVSTDKNLALSETWVVGSAVLVHAPPSIMTGSTLEERAASVQQSLEGGAIAASNTRRIAHSHR